ncbi:MAG: hypothetical protein GY760_06360 [Deltaproteobacteria bacterium]|nr:hypothetical protein [Deltaproteobacteria bacterium]
MDFKLSHRLKRAVKSVLNGLTIIRDNGLSLYNIKDLVSTSAHLIDYVELNTSALCSEESLLKRVDTYTKANITPYISGTMSEA